jgi:hypothetical protein
MAPPGKKPIWRGWRSTPRRGIVMSEWRPLIKGYFAVARWLQDLG